MPAALPALAAALALAAGPDVQRQDVSLALDPGTHRASVTAELDVRGAGTLELRLTAEAAIRDLRLDGRAVDHERITDEAEPRTVTLAVALPAPGRLAIEYDARFAEDVAAGERPGQIHNKAVTAHVGPEGLFLSDGSAWHPQPLGADGHPALHAMTLTIEPMDGWALVASGEPAAALPELSTPVRHWRTPRPVDGLAVAGGRHVITGRLHATPHGLVEVVTHVAPGHERFASMFLDAACSYLDLYVPLLGPFPYKRFSIVENFFSSGFAYPGFTLLGPRVVAMAPRSLAPGYLDHELLHNWWGNGVYVSPGDGNWCEALTSFCANYFRRVAEEGAEAGLAYRRGILMKVSAAPARDDGPLGEFGRDGGPGRFVGYDKGTFFFIMLTRLYDHDPQHAAQTGAWRSLRRFAQEHLGRRADWADLQDAFEKELAPDRPAGRLDGMFRLWVRRHTVPRTIPGDPADVRREFRAQYDDGPHDVEIVSRGSGFVEVDPRFRLYRLLPPQQIIPTMAGTTGTGGVAVVMAVPGPAAEALRAQLDADDDGENLLLVGAEAARARADLLERTTDPIRIGDRTFTVGGETWDGPDQAVLHTMQHPERPGRFVTVFCANGPAGRERLRYIGFYTRDTTIVWDGGRVVKRRLYEPDRRIAVGG